MKTVVHAVARKLQAWLGLRPSGWPKKPPMAQRAYYDHPGWIIDPDTGTWIWNEWPYDTRTAHWSGGRNQQGCAEGIGRLEWRMNGTVISTYQGLMIGGRYDGAGILTDDEDNRYDGMFRSGVLHGAATIEYKSGSRYEGELQDGRLHGAGKMVFANKIIYEGAWRYGTFFGEGTLSWPSAQIYVGHFVAGEFEGEGRMLWPNGDSYRGAWKQGCRHGAGRFEGQAYTYHGTWEGDQWHGHRHCHVA